MPDFLSYKSIPVGSLVDRSPEEGETYLQYVSELSPPLIDIAMSPKTGAYIRGLVKHHELPTTTAPKIAFVVLRIVTGELPLSAVVNTLTSEFQLTPALAQNIAAEIEHDLFAPVALELNKGSQKLDKESPRNQNEKLDTNKQAEGMQNVVNLKQPKRQRPKPSSFPLPPRPPAPPTPK